MITAAIEQGPRKHQEDRILYFPIQYESIQGNLFVVMDGHGDWTAADLCSTGIRNLLQLDLLPNPQDMLKVLISDLNECTQYFTSGTTVSMVVVTDDPFEATVAILGDSPVIVCDEEGKLHAYFGHNVYTNPVERQAAIERGAIYQQGYIFANRDSVGLQMGRALGDFDLADVLSRVPDVYTIARPVWVVAATDGLLDLVHEEEESSLIESMQMFAGRKSTADDLMSWAMQKGLRDNASAIVWSR